ncbi:MAG: hypothetical protein FWB71_05565 [Defluviitaleaceae bacterium]|nr:hypothetical protein [Defluviitaleaceae bacterium]
MADFRAYLSRVLSTHLVDDLFANSSSYIAHGGSLFTSPADRGTNISAGAEHHEFIRINDDIIIYRIAVDIHDISLGRWANTIRTHVEISEFALINIDGNWRFATFSLVR